MPQYVTTSLRDRTSDFSAVVERLKKQQGVTTSAAHAPSSAPLFNGTSSSDQIRPNGGASVQQQSEFAKKAALIGRSIHDTSQKLQKLAQLAKRTSMFDDPAEEIDRLTTIIKQDIQGLNSGIADLQRAAASNREGSKQSTFHSTTVVDNLRTRLKDTTKEFKDVLTTRTDSLKVHQNRREIYSAAGNKSSGPLGLGKGQAPVLRPNHGPKSAHELFGGSSNGAMQQQNPEQMQSLLANPQDTYMSTRAEALRNVESTIVELGGIFTQLASMVQEQGEMTVRIDENVEETLANVEGAQAHLLKYLNTISSNRWLIMKIMGVLMVFLVFFTVFIV